MTVLLLSENGKWTYHPCVILLLQFFHITKCNHSHYGINTDKIESDDRIKIPLKWSGLE